MSRATSTRSTGGFSDVSSVSDGDPFSRSSTVRSVASTGGFSDTGFSSVSEGEPLSRGSTVRSTGGFSSRGSTVTSARSAAGFESVTSDEGSVSLSRKSSLRSYRGFGDDVSLASVDGGAAEEADPSTVEDRAATPTPTPTPTNADADSAFPDVVSPPLSHPTLQRPKRKGARRPSRQVPDVVLAGSLDEMLQVSLGLGARGLDFRFTIFGRHAPVGSFNVICTKTCAEGVDLIGARSFISCSSAGQLRN